MLPETYTVFDALPYDQLCTFLIRLPTVLSCSNPEHPKTSYLLPDVIVTKEAADLSPGQWPGGIWVTVTRKHINAESFELTRVQCSGKESIYHHLKKKKSQLQVRHRSSTGNAADVQGKAVCRGILVFVLLKNLKKKNLNLHF